MYVKLKFENQIIKSNENSFTGKDVGTTSPASALITCMLC